MAARTDVAVGAVGVRVRFSLHHQRVGAKHCSVATPKRYLAGHKHPLVTVAPVVVEKRFFLRRQPKIELLTWIRRGAMSVADVSADAYAAIEFTLRKYADRDIDFADATLIWLANEFGLRNILTTDQSDFSTFGLKGGKRFELLEWL